MAQAPLARKVPWRGANRTAWIRYSSVRWRKLTRMVLQALDDDHRRNHLAWHEPVPRRATSTSADHEA